MISAIRDMARAWYHEFRAVYLHEKSQNQINDYNSEMVLVEAASHAEIARDILEQRKVHNSPSMAKRIKRLNELANATIY